MALHGRDKPRGSSALVGDSVTVVLGGVAGGVVTNAESCASARYVSSRYVSAL